MGGWLDNRHLAAQMDLQNAAQVDFDLQDLTDTTIEFYETPPP